jgi:hypothetical protein
VLPSNLPPELLEFDDQCPTNSIRGNIVALSIIVLKDVEHESYRLYGRIFENDWSWKMRKRIIHIYQHKKQHFFRRFELSATGEIALGTYFAVESGFFQDLLTFQGKGFRQAVECIDAQTRHAHELRLVFANKRASMT